MQNNILMDSNIQTLVFKAKQGDKSAFSTLYQIYYPKMKGICINILKEDKDVIDDLVQDAFILALVSLKDLKNPNRFGQWLTSITSNLALKYKEKGNTFRYISLSDIDESVIDSCDDCRNTVSSINTRILWLKSINYQLDTKGIQAFCARWFVSSGNCKVA